MKDEIYVGSLFSLDFLQHSDRDIVDKGIDFVMGAFGKKKKKKKSKK